MSTKPKRSKARPPAKKHQSGRLTLKIQPAKEAKPSDVYEEPALGDVPELAPEPGDLPEWVEETPGTCEEYQLAMWVNGGSEQLIDMTRSEYVALNDFGGRIWPTSAFGLGHEPTGKEHFKTEDSYMEILTTPSLGVSDLQQPIQEPSNARSTT
jgi:hypothetical protein